MRAILVLALCLAAVAAVPRDPQRIVGGTVTSIEQYPHMGPLLYTWNYSTWSQRCAGTIINANVMMTAAHCTINDPANRWRTRVGSTMANSGGQVLATSHILNHPSYNTRNYDSDISLLFLAQSINLNNNARPASISGTNYNLMDNQMVWAAGWGTLTQGSSVGSEQLRHVQIWTINQAVCRQRYASAGDLVTDNMLCSGWLDVGGRDQCQGDSGGPLFHNNVVVGVCSWGRGCANAFFPGVNTRVSRFTSWIQSNA